MHYCEIRQTQRKDEGNAGQAFVIQNISHNTKLHWVFMHVNNILSHLSLFQPQPPLPAKEGSKEGTPVLPKKPERPPTNRNLSFPQEVAKKMSRTASEATEG